MPRSTAKGELSSSHISFTSFFSLALWQVRRSKGLLGLITLSVLVAIVFVCMAPLYTDIVMTAGLQDAIGATTNNSSLILSGQVADPALASVNQLNTIFDNYLLEDLQPYLDSSKQHFTAEADFLSYGTTPSLAGALASTNKVALEGNDIAQIAQGKHVSLVRGRLPRIPTSQDKQPANTIEAALTQDSAAGLHVDVGSIIYVPIVLNIAKANKHKYDMLPVKVVGIVQNQKDVVFEDSDPFWHDNNLAPINLNPKGYSSGPWEYKILVANQALISALEQYIPITDRPFAVDYIPGMFDQARVPTPVVTLATPLSINWYYAFDPKLISHDQLSTIITSLQYLQTQPFLPASDALQYGLQAMHITLPIDALTNYQSQLAVAQTPAFGLVLVILSLLLYFVVLMTNLLVERQAAALAIVNSRGASRSQIFGALMLQGLGICLLALLLGPALALLAAAGLAWLWLSRLDDVAITTVLQDGRHAILSVSNYALLTALVVLCVLILAINQAVSSNMVTARSEAGRATHKPLWQRLHLDFIVIVVMVIAYGVSLYLTNGGVLDLQLQLLLLAPLILLRACLTIGVATLLFLRLVPFLLRWGSWWATQHSQGAPIMVALAQLSRSPRQSLRLAVLLSLTTAFVLFALVFSASQVQRAQDIATQTVGSDFNGTLINPPTINTLPTQVKFYQRLSGAQSVSLGDSENMLITDQNIPVNFLAVDPTTYTQTALLPTDDKAQTLSVLMQQLMQSDKQQTKGQTGVPVIVDEPLWETSHLHIGSIFALKIDNGGTYSSIYCNVIGKMDSIPLESTPGGVLADIHTYQHAYDQVINTSGDQPVTLNQVWLRTGSDPATIERALSALNNTNAQLLTVTSRLQLAATLDKEPLYLQIIGLLSIGPWLALFLVLTGSFVSSWMYTRDRLLNFALLRALGATPGLIARTLAWEQAITYALALLMGIIFGAFLSLTVVPAFIFTSVSGQQVTTENFYQLQNIPPVQLTFPFLLAIVVLALMVLCIGVLGMMMRIVSKPSLAAVLRLNED